MTDIISNFTPEQAFFFKAFLGIVFIALGMFWEGLLYFYLLPSLAAYGEHEIEITIFYIILTGLVKFWMSSFGVMRGDEYGRKKSK